MQEMMASMAATPRSRIGVERDENGGDVGAQPFPARQSDSAGERGALTPGRSA